MLPVPLNVQPSIIVESDNPARLFSYPIPAKLLKTQDINLFLVHVVPKCFTPELKMQDVNTPSFIPSSFTWPANKHPVAENPDVRLLSLPNTGRLVPNMLLDNFMLIDEEASPV
jgi:hypothetical protein